MRIVQHMLVSMNVLVVGRSLRERSTSTKSALVPDALVVLRQFVENVDNLLHRKGEETKTNTQSPIRPAESAFSNVECNRPKLNDKNLEYRGCDQDSAEQGISQDAPEHINC